MPSWRGRPTTGFISLVKTLGALASQKGKQANSYIVSFQTNFRNFWCFFPDWHCEISVLQAYLDHEVAFS